MTLTLTGTFTALVTPFRRDGALDEPALRRLVDFQVAGGVEGLVPCGTTGEAATLEVEEQLRVVEVVGEQAAGKLVVIAGAGGNSTAKVVAIARQIESLGVQAVLSVVPYYNKPTQEGMYRHFCQIADAVDVPVVLYNVPGRTGANLLPPTVLRLAGHGNIRGVKEASGNLLQVMEIIAGAPRGFAVLSGEDNLTFPMIALGAHGVISVVANEVPGLMSRMVREALAGHFAEAKALHYELLGLMNANFVETNPGPVKAALAMMGLVAEQYRLPMVPLDAAHRAHLRQELVKLELVDRSER